MKKIHFVFLMAALGFSSIALAQVKSLGNSSDDNVMVIRTMSFIAGEMPASMVTGELTDRDCPAGTTLIFDVNDANRAKCIISCQAQKR